MQTLRKTTLVELNVISAQLPACKSSSKTTQTYVVARINPNQKLTTRVDMVGNENPTWNDKFIFAISTSEVMMNPCSTMVFEIYCVRRFRKDKRIGMVHVLLESLISKSHVGECMAFHVRSSCGEPQGILNIGVSRLDCLLDHEVLQHSFLGSRMAVDYRELMGEEDSYKKDHQQVCRVQGLHKPPHHLGKFWISAC